MNDLPLGVILNPGSGYVAKHGVEETHTRIQDAVPHARIHVLSPQDDVTRCSRELISSGARILVAAGGDGMVNAVAAAVVGSEAALGVLPAGTLNHFAQDIGLCHGVGHALQALLTGDVKTIDVGSVNGNLFLNNSSVGLYPHLVELRERVEKRRGRGRATLEAALLMAQRRDLSRVSFTATSQTQVLHGTFLFVGNNRYEPDLIHRRFRPRLDEGVLWCLILDGPDTRQSVASAGLPGNENTPAHRGPPALTIPQFTVTLANDDATLVSTDGEVQTLRAPLEYRACRQALRVVVPSQATHTIVDDRPRPDRSYLKS